MTADGLTVIPAPAAAGVRADVSNAVLTLQLPKAAALKPRKIAVAHQN